MSFARLLFNRIMAQFRSYLVCGGMPSAATKMIESNDVEQVDATIQEILNDYILDFAKHATPQLTARIGHQVYNKTFSPSICIRYSALNLDKSGNLLNIPLFLADRTKQLLRNIT